MVQIYVSMLRKVLPEGVLVTRSPGYALELPPEAVDLVRFERLRDEGRAALRAGSHERAAELLREALALWRGPALAEFEEPFAADRVAAARGAAPGLHSRTASTPTSRLGRDASLIGELEALVARNPLRERPRSQLMVALYRAGRQADALAGYRGLQGDAGRRARHRAVPGAARARAPDPSARSDARRLAHPRRRTPPREPPGACRAPGHRALVRPVHPGARRARAPALAAGYRR